MYGIIFLMPLNIFKCLLCHYTYKLVLLLFSTSFAMGNFEFYEDLQTSFPVFKKKKLFLTGCVILKANQLSLLSLPSTKLIYEP
jgi:hypothetical protein